MGAVRGSPTSGRWRSTWGKPHIARCLQKARHHSSRRRRIEHTRDTSAPRTAQPDAIVGLTMQVRRVIVPMDYNAAARKSGPAHRTRKMAPKKWRRIVRPNSEAK